MSIIKQIRDRQGLLVAVIGLGMGLFILGDLFSSGNNQGSSDSIGEVNGESISAREFQMEVQERRRIGFNGDQLANEVWSDMTTGIVLREDIESLGLMVSDEEYDEMLFGTAFSAYLNQAFYSNKDTKAFWQENFRAMLLSDEGVRDFLAYKRLIVKKRVKEKYEKLVTPGIYSNSLEGKYDYIGGSEKATFNYVLKAFNKIEDTEVEVTDSDVKAYYNAHKEDAEYAQKAGRNITFVRIPLQASPEDAQAIQDDLSALRAAWLSSNDSDSLFVATANDQAFTAASFKLADVEIDVNEAQFFTAPKDSIIGPYKKNQTYRLSRVTERYSEPDSASCRHILLKATNPADSAEMAELMQRADSLQRVIKRGGSFEELASEYSEDPGSKSTGGFYDLFPRGRMVAPFENFCFENAPGTLGAVETSFGVHVIEVMEHTQSIERARVAVIERTIEPSLSTARASFNIARNFAIAANSKEEFMQAAGDAGYATSEALDIERNATNISGLRNAGELVSWAYNAEVDEVSNPVLIDKNYVVGYLDRITEKGVPPFEYVENEMRTGAVKQAKGELYAAKMAEGTLEQIAEAVASTVESASGISLKNPRISEAGSLGEPEVVGKAFAIPVGNISAPIIGNNGVWVIAPTQVAEAVEKTDFLTEQTNLLNRARGASTIRLNNAMLEAAGLQDNRN